MHDSSTASGAAWDVTSANVSPGRRSLGRVLIVGGTAGLLAVSFLQTLDSFASFKHGFSSWQPIMWAYVLWSFALSIGLVLMRGERGHRAVFVLPAVLFTLAMVVFPTIFGLYLAFTDWNLSATAGRQWNGVANIKELFQDEYFWNAMRNMGYYLLAVLVQYAIAFGLALLLNADIRARKFFRVAFLLPFMLSPVAVSWMIGKSIFDSNKGPAADLLRWLGVQEPAFFSTPWTARLSIMSMDAWVSIPFIMVLLLAGLQALPGEVMESAKVDGATGWSAFWQMTFPLMLPVSVTAVVLRVIFELKLADIVINVTGGGPGGATDSVSSYIWREYRDRSNVGYGTAMAEFYLIAIIIFVTLLLNLVSRWMRKVT